MTSAHMDWKLSETHACNGEKLDNHYLSGFVFIDRIAC